MPTLKVGGTEHQIPEMNFVAVERAWPYVELAMETVHPIAGTNAAIAVIAASIMEGEKFDPKDWDISPVVEQKDDSGTVTGTFPKDDNGIHKDLILTMRRRLKANEIGAVKLCMFEILVDAGFELGAPGSGEDQAAVEVASPSPETAQDGSQSSLPLDVKGEAGTT